jgi:hypothetical protein
MSHSRHIHFSLLQSNYKYDILITSMLIIIIVLSTKCASLNTMFSLAQKNICYVFFVCVVSVFDLRASYLLGRCSTTWAMLPSPFCFSYFSERVLHFLPLCSWMNATMPGLLVEMGSLFLSRLASNHDLPDLCLPHSWDYIHERFWLAFVMSFNW